MQELLSNVAIVGQKYSKRFSDLVVLEKNHRVITLIIMFSKTTEFFIVSLHINATSLVVVSFQLTNVNLHGYKKMVLLLGCK